MAAPFFSTPFQPYVYQSPHDGISPFQIFGSDFQVVQIMLKPQDKIVAKPGCIGFTTGAVEMENVFLQENDVGIWQWLFGRTVANVVVRNPGPDDGFVAVSAPSLGRILPIDLALFGGEVLCQPDAFLCSINDVKVTSSFDPRSRHVVPSLEGFLKQKLSGDGLAFIVATGSVMQKTLEIGEVMTADVACVVAANTSITAQVKANGQMKRTIFGGENTVTVTLTGPGIVFLQSTPFQRLAQRVARAVTSPNMKENPKFFAQIALFFFLAYVVLLTSLFFSDA